MKFKATIDTVKSKINTIRCTFKKENLKVKSSQISGSGTNDIYVPKLWYYDLLQFFTDREVPRASRSNINRDDEEIISDDVSNINLLMLKLIFKFNLLTYKKKLMNKFTLPWNLSFICKMVHEVFPRFLCCICHISLVSFTQIYHV